MGTDARALTEVVGHDRIDLDAVDLKGRRRKVQLRATIIAPSAAVRDAMESRPVRKQDDDDADEYPTVDKPTSLVRTQDEGFAGMTAGQLSLVTPPYNVAKMAVIPDMSTELGQCIRAMVTNVVGFGWDLRERAMPEEMRKQLAPEIEREKFMLSARLSAVHPLKSLTALRKMEHHDKYTIGAGALELVDSPNGSLVGVNHIHSYSIRMTKKQRVPTLMSVPALRPEQSFAVEEVPMWYRFRRFAQLQDASLVWFKEAGDPRQMEWRTGRYARKGEVLPFKDRATALVYSPIYHPATVYGVPFWIGNVFSIMGSNSAEKINYNTINSNAIPSMMVVVENGSLTEASIQRLKEWTEEHVQRSENYSTFLLLEGEPNSDGTPEPGALRIRIEPMKRMQQTDEMFQDYDRNNKDKQRQAYRLPPLFVGSTKEYNKATAVESRKVADEQVFSPEREEADNTPNRFMLPRWGARFHVFKSRTPNITDDTELIKLMAIAERSGAMTPRRADRIVRDVFGDDIGPMPKGIDPDRPYSIQFAEAQGGRSTPGGSIFDQNSGGPNPAKGLLEGLMDIRRAVEDELESRALLGEAAA